MIRQCRPVPVLEAVHYASTEATRLHPLTLREAAT